MSITLKSEQLFPACPWDKFSTLNAILTTIFSAVVCAVYYMFYTLQKSYEEEIFLQFRCFQKTFLVLVLCSRGPFSLICDIIPMTVC